MTVAELIEKLSKLDPDLTATVWDGDGFFEPVEDLRVVQTRTLNQVEIISW